MKGVGNFGDVNENNGELSLCIRRLKNHINFSSRNSFSLGVLSHISEIGVKTLKQLFLMMILVMEVMMLNILVLDFPMVLGVRLHNL